MSTNERSKRKSDLSSEPGSEDSSAEEKRKTHGKHKKQKKHKKTRKSDAREELLKQAKSFLDKHTEYKEESNPVEVKETLTEADYYLKNAEFCSWLLEARKQYFNELDTGETHALFQDFVHVWNDGRLPVKYYSGKVEAPKRLTKHKWNLK